MTVLHAQAHIRYLVGFLLRNRMIQVKDLAQAGFPPLGAKLVQKVAGTKVRPCPQLLSLPIAQPLSGSPLLLHPHRAKASCSYLCSPAFSSKAVS